MGQRSRLRVSLLGYTLREMRGRGISQDVCGVLLIHYQAPSNLYGLHTKGLAVSYY